MVLISAPFREDEAVIGGVLQRAGITTRPTSAEDIAEADVSTVEAIVLSQDALNTGLLRGMRTLLDRQEAWSELPLILLMDEQQQSQGTADWVARSLPRARAVLLQRPVRPATFISAVSAGIAARRRQFEVRDHLRWEAELQLEMNHRVKNVLANALAIFHMARRNSQSLAELSDSFEDRLLALTRAHGALVRAAEAQDFEIVARASTEPYDRTGQQIVISGEPLRLKPSAAVTLALCLHELASNASEHGALSLEGGTAALHWEATADQLRLRWCETPARGPVPAARGYGLTFIETAARRGLKGDCSFETSDGAYVFQMQVPLSQVSVAHPADDGGAP